LFGKLESRNETVNSDFLNSGSSGDWQKKGVGQENTEEADFEHHGFTKQMAADHLMTFCGRLVITNLVG
jgi:hypothetical protein